MQAETWGPAGLRPVAALALGGAAVALPEALTPGVGEPAVGAGAAEPEDPPREANMSRPAARSRANAWTRSEVKFVLGWRRTESRPLIGADEPCAALAPWMALVSLSGLGPPPGSTTSANRPAMTAAAESPATH